MVSLFATLVGFTSLERRLVYIFFFQKSIFFKKNSLPSDIARGPPGDSNPQQAGDKRANQSSQRESQNPYRSSLALCDLNV